MKHDPWKWGKPTPIINKIKKEEKYMTNVWGGVPDLDTELNLSCPTPKCRPAKEESCKVGHYNSVHRIPIEESDAMLGHVDLKMDPYFVASVWKVGEKDPSGCLFHILKTIARFGEKEENTTERELDSILKTIQRKIELEE